MPVVGLTFSAHWPGVQSDAKQCSFFYSPRKAGGCIRVLP